MSVSAKNQIYLVGTENSTFNFNKFEYDTKSNGNTINAKGLISYGGFGKVGTKENHLRVNLTG